MVNFALFLTVAFGLFISQGAIAAPTTAAEATGDTRFSFSAWVDSIIANPETALSPEEAVQAFLDSMDSGSAPATLDKRVDFNYTVECLTDWTPDVSAQAIDIATIIYKFASMGQVPCPAPEKTTHASGLIGGSNLTTLVYDAFRTAWLMPQGRGYASEDANKRGTCQNIAQTAAVVMDRCTQLNGTVTGLMDDDVTGTKVGVMIAKNPGDFAWP